MKIYFIFFLHWESEDYESLVKYQTAEPINPNIQTDHRLFISELAQDIFQAIKMQRVESKLEKKLNP